MTASFSHLDCVIKEPLKFKLALAIGEDAYTSLRCGNKVKEWWDLIGAVGSGAAAAKSSVIATTFFAPHWLLATFGLGTAVTPVGWIVAAAVVSGGAWYGVQKLAGTLVDERISKIPKFINTPIDALAVSLFDLLAPLALKVAESDGTVTNDERETIFRYLVCTWGFDEKFVEAGIGHLEQHLAKFSIEDIARRLAEFKKNSPDCNFEAMSQNILAFLTEIMESDGQIDESEQKAIEHVQAIFYEVGRSALSKRIDSINGSMAGSIKKASQSVSTSLDTTKIRLTSLTKGAESASGTARAAVENIFSRIKAARRNAS